MQRKTADDSFHLQGPFRTLSLALWDTSQTILFQSPIFLIFSKSKIRISSTTGHSIKLICICLHTVFPVVNTYKWLLVHHHKSRIQGIYCWNSPKCPRSEQSHRTVIEFDTASIWVTQGPDVTTDKLSVVYIQFNYSDAIHCSRS